MSINIIDKSGKTKIILDDADQKKDVVVDASGKEISYDEAAAAKEKEVADAAKASGTPETPNA